MPLSDNERAELRALVRRGCFGCKRAFRGDEKPRIVRLEAVNAIDEEGRPRPDREVRVLAAALCAVCHRLFEESFRDARPREVQRVRAQPAPGEPGSIVDGHYILPDHIAEERADRIRSARRRG